MDSKMKKEVESFAKVYNNVTKYPTNQTIGEALGISEATVRRKARDYKRIGVELVSRGENTETDKLVKANKEVHSLRKNIEILERQVKVLTQESLSHNQLLKLIHGAKANPITPNADWLNFKSKKTNESLIPVLFLSDLHFDEVVDPRQIEFVNAYNHDIAVDRLKIVFHKFLSECRRAGQKNILGVTVALGGDMLSGIIHEELAESNDAAILRSIMDLSKILVEFIGTCADEFKKVFVPCVVGNHGRLHKKPRFKHKVEHNFEWLIYQIIANHFAKDSRVDLDIPLGSDCNFKVFDVNICLTHGDQFSGGNGIAGIFSPIMRGAAKKQQRQASLRKRFDLMMIGHFHQYIHTNSLLINSSLKGMDEYAFNFNFGFEDPQQAMFIVDKDEGVTMRMPLVAKYKP